MAVGLDDQPLDCKLTKGPSIAQIEPTSLPDDVRTDASVLHVIHAHPAHAHIPINTHTRHRARPTASVDAATSYHKAIEQAARPPEMRGVPNPSATETPTTGRLNVRQGVLINSIALTDNQLG